MFTVAQRRSEIANTTATHGHSSVAELALRFDVTQETIRRDLKALEADNLVHRVHGGAVAPLQHNEPAAQEPSFAQAFLRYAPEKKAIAHAALRLLPATSGSMFLDAGTTTAAFAAAMTQHYRDQRWTVVTNSLPAAMTLSIAGVPGINLLGGPMRTFTRAVIGQQAVQTLDSLRADIAFLGTNAISAQHGLSTPDPTAAAVKQAMVRQASQVVVLCDSSKFNQDFLVTFADLDDIDIVVTDSNASPKFLSLLRSHKIEVVQP
ncbi:DeoR/GlpR family DNA-binding transcription regulator [Corynebacterium freiburgense]|uniref:DeoR/GlpR family DNA-binding transcription regulator n=1 Tax=Corynebacterium freiburgense TaxID=556548 RepID=UPI0004179FA5|nr:DeoR/GlpR family DNA-binding transcription regulator [Corynebacterium freiburgense]WJZ02891.1 Glycerol-3-phosphate regulon repressor [Corynebacterium freiburgense]